MLLEDAMADNMMGPHVIPVQMNLFCEFCGFFIRENGLMPEEVSLDSVAVVTTPRKKYHRGPSYFG